MILCMICRSGELTILDFNEYFSDFNSVRHNDWFTLFLFYGVMKYVP